MGAAASRKEYARVILGALAAAALLHGTAGVLFLYWSYPWFDIPVHFLGGFFAGSLPLWFISRPPRAGLRPVSAVRALLLALAGAMAAGVLWEAFESAFGLSFAAAAGYRLETAKDLSVNLVGAYAAYRYFAARGYGREGKNDEKAS